MMCNICVALIAMMKGLTPHRRAKKACRVRRQNPDGVQFDDFECRDLLHPGSSAFPNGWATLNLGLHAIARNRAGACADRARCKGGLIDQFRSVAAYQAPA